MLTIYQLKPAFQGLLRPLVVRLAGAGISANQVTLAACLVSLAVAALVAALAAHAWIFWLIPLWMFLRMALNAIDGMLAREFGQKSNLGAYLNELCDVIADSALFLPFLMVAGISAPLLIGVVLLALVSEYAGVMGPLVGASRRYDGPMGKSDRAFAFGVLAAGIATGWLPALGMNLLLAVVAALLLLTIYNRVARGLAELG